MGKIDFSICKSKTKTGTGLFNSAAKILPLFVILLSCSNMKMSGEVNNISLKITDITGDLPVTEFEAIKHFVLKNGDRQTFRNFDNDNPHYDFAGFDVYFSSDSGQKNINNDPALSDFNEMTIYDRNSDVRYFHIVLVRKHDIENKKMWIRNGMKEEKVYLVDTYDNGMEHLQSKLMDYLEKIKRIRGDAHYSHTMVSASSTRR